MLITLLNILVCRFKGSKCMSSLSDPNFLYDTRCFRPRKLALWAVESWYCMPQTVHVTLTTEPVATIDCCAYRHARKTLQQTKAAAAGTGTGTGTTTKTTTTTTTTKTTGTTGATATVTPVVGGVVAPMGLGVVNPLGVGPVGVGVVGMTTTPRTASTTVTTVTTVQTTKGPVKVGTVATGRARIMGGAAKVGASAAKVQNSQAETCRSVGPREYCGTYEQVSVPAG
jgi:hypothetical protein